MTLNRRERTIGIVAAAIIALLLLDRFLLTPYLTRRDSLTRDIDRLQQSQRQANDVLARQKRLQPEWADYQKSRGLMSAYSEAEGQATRAILNWAQSSGVNLAGLKSERTVAQDRFQIISFNVTATGSLANLSQLLYAIETAATPIKLNDVQLAPRRENTDDLTLQMSVSTIAYGGRP